jgi:hypothetical protein
MGGEHMGEAPAAEPAYQPSSHQSYAPSPAEPTFQRTPPEPAYQQRPEPSAAKEPAPPRVETERAPIQHNVPPLQEISGPAANPKKGWWRR